MRDAVLSALRRWWCGQFHDPKRDWMKEGPTYRCGVCGEVRVAPWASAGEVERWEARQFGVSWQMAMHCQKGEGKE